eukprot:6180710-Pleurochrysis_carterae.AAC.1
MRYLQVACTRSCDCDCYCDYTRGCAYACGCYLPPPLRAFARPCVCARTDCFSSAFCERPDRRGALATLAAMQTALLCAPQQVRRARARAHSLARPRAPARTRARRSSSTWSACVPARKCALSARRRTPSRPQDSVSRLRPRCSRRALVARFA